MWLLNGDNTLRRGTEAGTERSRGQERTAPNRRCASFAVIPNTTAKIMLRGWRLNDASEVRVGDGKIATKIISKGAAALLERYDLKRVGDQQVEFEFIVPSGSRLKRTIRGRDWPAR